jgi:hypothetical protein
MRKELQDLVDVCVICVIAVVPVALIAIFMYGLFSLLAPKACAMEKLGTISRNPFIGDSTSNPFSMYNNRFSPDSPRNPFGPYGNYFSPYSANNPYSMQSPGIYGYADEGYNDSTDSYADDGAYE